MKNLAAYSPGRRFCAQLSALADSYCDLLEELEDLRTATESLYEELSPVLEDIYDSLAFFEEHQAAAYEASDLPFTDHTLQQGILPARKRGG